MASISNGISLDEHVILSSSGLESKQLVSIVGGNVDINGTEEDLWDHGGSLSYLASEEIINLASDSTADTSPLVVLVSGVNDSGQLIQDTVSLNGTSVVSTSIPFSLIHSLLLTGVGDTNVGIITATASISATVQAKILPLTSISYNGFFRVPTGYKFVFQQVEINAARESGGQSPIVSFFLNIRPAPSSPWLKIDPRRLDTSVQVHSTIDYPPVGSLSGGSEIRLSASSTETNTEVLYRISGFISKT